MYLLCASTQAPCRFADKFFYLAHHLVLNQLQVILDLPEHQVIQVLQVQTKRLDQMSRVDQLVPVLVQGLLIVKAVEDVVQALRESWVILRRPNLLDVVVGEAGQGVELLGRSEVEVELVVDGLSVVFGHNRFLLLEECLIGLWGL